MSNSIYGDRVCTMCGKYYDSEKGHVCASTGRDSRGRFTPGHPFAKLGWRGLVQKRFGGDVAAAKTWLGKVGAWEYARQAQITRRGVFQHPGTPEQWLEEWRRRIEFTLADVGEMKF